MHQICGEILHPSRRWVEISSFLLAGTMGRRANYTTDERRKHAAEERKCAYADSTQWCFILLIFNAHINRLFYSSGKEIRSAQNKRAYQKRRTEALKHSAAEEPLPEPPLVPPDIPNLLKKYAEVPLPIALMHFKKEAQSRYEIDKEEADQFFTYWDNPPYIDPKSHIPMGPASYAHEYTVCGRRRRLQQDYERERILRIDALSDAQILEEIHSEIVKATAEWMSLKEILFEHKAAHSPNARNMGKSLLCGKARRVIDFVEDWDAVKMGGKEQTLRILYLNRWGG